MRTSNRGETTAWILGRPMRRWIINLFYAKNKVGSWTMAEDISLIENNASPGGNLIEGPHDSLSSVIIGDGILA
jgi:hypothetical protein